MKFPALLTALLLSFTTLVAAAPAPAPVPIPSPNEATAELLKRSIYDAYERAFSAAAGGPEVDKRRRRQLSSSTRNDLEQGKCADAIVVYARGTTETGNIGTVLSGPLIASLDTVLRGRYIFQGVNDYPADVAGYLLGGSRTGARNMAAQVSRAATQCPGSKVFLVGYSQGSQVAHLAGDLIPTSQRSVVAGIVLFGDPNNGDRFPGTLNGNVLTVCDLVDPICYGVALPVGTHLTYYLDAPRAAAYIASKV